MSVLLCNLKENILFLHLVKFDWSALMFLACSGADKVDARTLPRANKLRLTLLFSFFISHLYSLLPGELFGISSEEFLSHVQMSQKLMHTEVFYADCITT